MTTQERMLLTALEEKDHWRSRALKAEERISEFQRRADMEPEVNRIKSNLDKPGYDCPLCGMATRKQQS